MRFQKPSLNFHPRIQLLNLLTIIAILCNATAVQATEGAVQGEGGVNALISKDSGVAVNGNVNSSTINSTVNELTTGNNQNMNTNVIAPTLLTPTQSAASGGAASGGTGGSAVLMLPRNPLPMPNALLGRSNFGLQFGLQNNPILAGMNNLNGKQNALGWFLQAGLSIPFGKIPDVYRNRQGSQLDTARLNNLEHSRNVYGTTVPSNNSVQYNRDVKGKLSGMGAYNYSTIPSSKITVPDALNMAAGEVKISQAKLLALAPAQVYTKPLNVGKMIGVIEVGSEYPYLGHTKSGWVKIILPNGTEGWTSSQFEYIKHDYTEVDALAEAPGVKIGVDKENAPPILKTSFNKNLQNGNKASHVQ